MVIDPHNPPQTITLEEGQIYLPIIFKTTTDKDLIGMNVKIPEDTTGFTVNVVAGHTDGVGSSTRVLGEDGRLKTDYDNSDILEYAYIERNGGAQEEITLEFFEYDPSQGGKN